MRRVVQVAQLVAALAALVFVVMLFANEPGAPEPAGTDSGGGAGSGETVSGQAVYAANCAICHGADGDGGVGPRLAGRMVEAYPDVADQIAVVTDGRGGMPSFAARLDPEEIRAVVDYTRTELGA